MQFIMTPQHVRDIYMAGVRRGNDEASAYEHGARASGDVLDNLEETLLYDLGFHDRLDYDEKRAWWDRFKAALTKNP